jgi:hypothetical protein
MPKDCVCWCAPPIYKAVTESDREKQNREHTIYNSCFILNLSMHISFTNKIKNKFTKDNIIEFLYYIFLKNILTIILYSRN